MGYFECSLQKEMIFSSDRYDTVSKSYTLYTCIEMSHCALQIQLLCVDWVDEWMGGCILVRDLYSNKTYRMNLSVCLSIWNLLE